MLRGDLSYLENAFKKVKVKELHTINKKVALKREYKGNIKQ